MSAIMQKISATERWNHCRNRIVLSSDEEEEWARFHVIGVVQLGTGAQSLYTHTNECGRWDGMEDDEIETGVLK